MAFDKTNFAPRAGVAWSVAKNTVVRGAFGVFYSAEANIFDDLGLNPPQDNFYAASYNTAALPTPDQLISTGFPDSFPAYDPNNLYGAVKTTGPKRLMPRILEWNLTIQHQFAGDWAAQVGYVATHATRLWNHESTDLTSRISRWTRISAGRIRQTASRTTALF